MLVFSVKKIRVVCHQIHNMVFRAKTSVSVRVEHDQTAFLRRRGKSFPYKITIKDQVRKITIKDDTSRLNFIQQLQETSAVAAKGK